MICQVYFQRNQFTAHIYQAVICAITRGGNMKHYGRFMLICGVRFLDFANIQDTLLFLSSTLKQEE